MHFIRAEKIVLRKNTESIEDIKPHIVKADNGKELIINLNTRSYW